MEVCVTFKTWGQLDSLQDMGQMSTGQLLGHRERLGVSPKRGVEFIPHSCRDGIDIPEIK